MRRALIFLMILCPTIAVAQIDESVLTQAVVDCQLRFGADREQFVDCLTNVEEGYRRYLGALERAVQDPTIERLLRASVEQCSDIWQGDWTYIGICAQMQLRGFGEVIQIQNSGENAPEIVGPALDTCAAKWEGDWARIGYCLRRTVQPAAQ